jgi:hypothetical protein
MGGFIPALFSRIHSYPKLIPTFAEGGHMRLSDETYLAWCLGENKEKLVKTVIVTDTFARDGYYYGRRITNKAKLVLPFAAKVPEELREVLIALDESKPDLMKELQDIERVANRIGELYGLYKTQTAARDLLALMAKWEQLARNLGRKAGRDVDGQDLANLIPATFRILGMMAEKHKIILPKLDMAEETKAGRVYEGWMVRAIALPRTTDPQILGKFDSWQPMQANELNIEDAITQDQFLVVMREPIA